jgi:Phosphopantetheine attachment site
MTTMRRVAMDLPTLDDSVDLLKTVSGLDDIDPDTPLQSSEVDSLNLVEWVYEMQERHPEMTIDESIVDSVGETVTFREVHDQMIRAQHVASAASTADDA